MLFIFFFVCLSWYLLQMRMHCMLVANLLFFYLPILLASTLYAIHMFSSWWAYQLVLLFLMNYCIWSYFYGILLILYSMFRKEIVAIHGTEFIAKNKFAQSFEWFFLFYLNFSALLLLLTNVRVNFQELCERKRSLSVRSSSQAISN